MQPQIKGDQAPKRRAHHRCVFALRTGAVGFVDQGFEFFDQKAGVIGALTTVHCAIEIRGFPSVFSHALGSIVDAHHNHGFNRLGADQFFEIFIDLPLTATKRSAAVKEIIAIVHVQDGIAAAGFLRVLGR